MFDLTLIQPHPVQHVFHTLLSPAFAATLRQTPNKPDALSSLFLAETRSPLLFWTDGCRQYVIVLLSLSFFFAAASVTR